MEDNTQQVCDLDMVSSILLNIVMENHMQLSYVR